jgi:hypothetical protein
LTKYHFCGIFCFMAQPKYTPEQIRFAAEVIRETYDQESGRHQSDIFYAITETKTLPVVELVIIAPGTDKVLLTRRPDDDPYYAGAWHLPGVIVTTADTKSGPYQDAKANAALRAKHELDKTSITPLVPMANWLDQSPRISKRGGEAAVFYGAYLIDEEPATGQMFDANNLPEPIHEHHPELIAKAPLSVPLAHASLYYEYQ